MARFLPAAVALILCAFLAGCSAESTGSPPPGGGKTGKTYPNAAEAPTYAGTAFTGMQIFDLEAGVYLDEAALLETLDEDRLVLFGEQHLSAPVQELELWLLERMTARHDDVSLAMEHFQRDEQPILDRYIAGEIETAAFETTSQPWKGYATYWKPLVEHMKAKRLRVAGLNVPDEALQMIYAQGPTAPLKVFNGFGASFKYDKSVAPRPLAAWDATYKSYFEGSFDYSVHGEKMGMTYADALIYFTDLAHIRDETMAYFLAEELKGGGRVMTVAGDWHVQTGLAMPDRTVRYAGDSPRYALVTTTPKAKLDELKNKKVSDRTMARFFLVFEGG